MMSYSCLSLFFLGLIVFAYFEQVGEIKEIRISYLNYKSNKEMFVANLIGEANFFKTSDGDFIPLRLLFQNTNCDKIN